MTERATTGGAGTAGASPDLVGLPDVDRVLAEPDPVLRNRAVTDGYHALAVRMAGLLPHPDLTWCAFATWASATAGRMIATEEMPRRFQDALDVDDGYQSARAAAGPEAHPGVVAAGQHLAVQVSASVSAGNTLVFAELAPVFLALLAGADVPAATAPPLVEAAARYRAALATSDAAEAAGQVLAANVLAVHHEQQRLQPYIATSLDQGLADVAQALVRERALADAAAHLGAAGSRAFAEASRVWDTVLTRHAMTLTTPERVFDLGRDVPPLPDGALGPTALATLAVPDPAEVVGAFDRTGGTLVGSAARDWADLGERMNYVVNLFRSRQQSAVLLQPPG